MKGEDGNVIPFDRKEREKRKVLVDLTLDDETWDEEDEIVAELNFDDED